MFVVDRDCEREQNSEAAARVEQRHEKLVACCAVEEVETWMLALHRDEHDLQPWQNVRAECDVKETYAEPFLRRKAWGGPGKGRKTAMRALCQQWRALLQVCDEVAALRDRIAKYVQAH